MLKAWMLHEDSEFPGIHPLPDLVQRLKSLVRSLAFTTKEEHTIVYLSKFVELNILIEVAQWRLAKKTWNKYMQLRMHSGSNCPTSLSKHIRGCPQARKAAASS